ncbi:glycosyltransferase, partial [Diplonema papillatum]
GIMPEQPVMWGAVIRNAWVKDGNVFTCTHAFTTGACLWEMKGFTGGVTRVEKVFAFCDKWCRGYFHFTHEHLPRVATMYSLLEADPKVMIAVPTNRDYIVSFFEDVLGIDKTRLIGTGTVFADQVYYPQPQTCGNTWTHTLMLLRRVVFSRHMLDHSVFLDDGLTYNNTHHLAGAPGHNFVVVWAERAGGISGKSRNPTNYEAVKAKLIDDFPNVAFQSSHGKNTLEQVKLFNRAHMVIGPHGANLANIMWCRHGASVVEFMSYKYAIFVIVFFFLATCNV